MKKCLLVLPLVLIFACGSSPSTTPPQAPPSGTANTIDADVDAAIARLNTQTEAERAKQDSEEGMHKRALTPTEGNLAGPLAESEIDNAKQRIGEIRTMALEIKADVAAKETFDRAERAYATAQASRKGEDYQSAIAYYIEAYNQVVPKYNAAADKIEAAQQAITSAQNNQGTGSH